ncbi:hypothetical protein K435DRAFT_772364, partial [Dendrothele bispora CBS 962.96]
MSPVNVLVGATTTTVVIHQPTTASTSSTQVNTIPVAAIAGGTVGGVVLALIILWAWQVWGRSIKRTDAKKKKETDALRITKQNTMRNAYAFSNPHSHSYKPLFWPPSDAKVKFATPDRSESPNMKSKGLMMPREVVPVITKPKPLRSSGGGDSSKSPETEIPAPTMTEIKPPAPARIPRNSPNTTRTARTTTACSTGSAEERVKQSAFHSLITALGSDAGQNTPRTSQLSGTNRLSTTSNWSWFSRSTRGTQSRNSQATSASAYSQPDASLSNDVGVAY